MSYLLVILVIFAGYRSLGWLDKKLIGKKWKWIVTVPLYLMSMILLAIIARLFFFEICVVPSGSMEDTILINDHVLINKMAYGPRLPRHITDMPWLQVLYYFAYGAEKYQQKIEEVQHKNRKRISGYTQVHRNDIIIFESPTGSGNLLIKRCVAIPGDTVHIQEGILYINNTRVEPPDLCKMNYKIYFDSSTTFQEQARKIRKPVYFRSDTLIGSLNKSELDAFKSIEGYRNHILIVTSSDTAGTSLWPSTFSNSWSKDHYGPLVIPMPKTIARIDSTDLLPNEFMHLEDMTRIPENYYFILGDNRNHSLDSRFWGLVPESSIKGKGSIVLFNYRHHLFWTRLLKNLN